MDVVINPPVPAGLKFSRFLRFTLPKLVRSYGELIVISEEVEAPGDLLCLMQNALLLVRLSVRTSELSSEISGEHDYPHILLKILLHHIIRVHWSEKQYLEISTARGRCQIGVADNAYYRNWRPSLKFVTARRLAFEIRLRISSVWSDEDNQEAEFFVGDIPAADRAEDDTNSRLAAIYGSILYEGSVQQSIARQTLWRTTKHHWETQYLVLRESALLLYKGRPMSAQDQCINLRAVKAVTSLREAPTSLLILTGTKSFPLLFDSAAEARDWIRAIRGAIETLRPGPACRRISALERVNHLTTQISIPRDPHASGAFANIYKGTWEVAAKGLPPEGWYRRTAKVAVKVFLDRKSQGLVFEKGFIFSKKLRREVNVWCRLDHPNIVPLLGITYDFGTSLSMVSPWLQKGTLQTYLNSSTARLKDLRPLLMDITNGLSYLHSKNVIHGDLHPANILINEQGHAQLTDFGLSMIIPDFEGTSYLTTSSMGGAVRWAAPEVFCVRPNGDTSLNVSTMSDVYSFGGIMYQVLCGEIPFAEITNDIRVVFAVKDGQRPERAQQISQVNWEFIQRCWSSQPLKRPLLPAIHEFLEQSFETPYYDGIEAAAAGI
ncbi:kinase-like domain-containing protein [Mycena olivaceomarginata]|nr:kinase-like domain-containing protein [Mycena olivaceomarginata]